MSADGVVAPPFCPPAGAPGLACELQTSCPFDIAEQVPWVVVPFIEYVQASPDCRAAQASTISVGGVKLPFPPGPI